MLGKNRTERNSLINNPALRSLSVLSSSSTVKGEISIDDDLRIDGNVDGDINSGGKVVIGPDGCVKGKITGKSVEVIGKILGDVKVADIVILRASSHYEGQITTRSIEIEAAPTFYGSCKMEGDGINKDNKSVPIDSIAAPITDRKEII